MIPFRRPPLRPRFVDLEQLGSWWDLPPGLYWGPAGPYAADAALRLASPAEPVVFSQQLRQVDAHRCQVQRLVVPLTSIEAIGDYRFARCTSVADVAAALTEAGHRLVETTALAVGQADAASAAALAVPVGATTRLHARRIRDRSTDRVLAVAEYVIAWPPPLTGARHPTTHRHRQH